ncbi:class I SAM-dependent methyltransferase [Propionicimonas sp.]|uniref:class I SAM-dependent methyltransferase n=1 Tax=Propionicimonas sp. TaxID=1955623 RepID=UPI0039E23DE5
MTTPQPAMLKWDNETLSRFWGYYSQFPELYFSRQKGRDVIKFVSGMIPKNATVLDYGCGPGHLLPYLLDEGYTVLGADISLETIGSAVNVRGRDNFMGFDTIDGLLSSERKFDAIFLLEVIEHLDDQALELTLSQARRLLKKGGLFVVTTPNEERLEDSMVYCPVANVIYHRWQHMRSWSAAQLADTLSSRGFHDVKVETRNFRDISTPKVSQGKLLISEIFNRFRKPQSILATARG